MVHEEFTSSHRPGQTNSLSAKLTVYTQVTANKYILKMSDETCSGNWFQRRVKSFAILLPRFKDAK